MDECSCPVCPLVKANLQVCDLIYEQKRDKYGLTCAPEHRVFHLQFEQLVASAMSQKLPIGATWTHDGKDHDCNIMRISKNIYKICFHTLTSDNHMSMD